ncbi:hypothetical protein Sjap_012171 [Stephania japonica]|uniref:Cytochrome P450 n=1 Tax=Stephania japonica TaxID=461633 RepID=A0AAP0IVL2_9MAGN
MDDPKWQAMILKEFNVLLKGVFQLPIYFPAGTRHFKAVKAAEVIRKELVKVIETKREMKSSHGKVEKDLISHLMNARDENGNLLKDKEIADNVILLMDSGHDTSSSTMMMLMKYLAETPNCYQRVLEEQREIISQKKPGELLNKNDIQKMKYSSSVVNEVFRLSPPLLGTFRKAKVDFTYNGFSIPKDWTVWWITRSTHNDPQYFPNPEKFDPERFDRDAITPHSFVPFGGGPRMCPGKEFARVEILAFLHNLVKNFRWELVFPDELISVDPMPTSPKGLPKWWPPSLKKLFGDSFFTAPYNEDIRTRKMIVAFLHQEVMEQLVERFDKTCKKCMECDWIGNNKVLAFSLIKKCAFYIACDMFASMDDSNWQAMMVKEFNILVKGVFRLQIYFP